MIKIDFHENIKLIHKLIKKQIENNAQDLGVTCSQSGILIYILMNKNNPINQRDIEQVFNLSNPTVNGILNRLEKKDLIKRVVSLEDKRVKNIIPLKKAEEFEIRLENLNQENNKKMLRNINDQELNIFYNVLEKIKNNLKESLNERNI